MMLRIEWGSFPPSISPNPIFHLKTNKTMLKPNLTEKEYEGMFVFMIAIIVGAFALAAVCLYNIFC